LPDADDETFLEIAIATKAKFLITGNILHYPPLLREGIDILSPSDFIKLYRK
jgi:uncharacterized protein